MNKENRIKELVNLLNKASYEYYNTGYPIMEDSEFDNLLDELQRLEAETGMILKDSPTINAGSKVAKEQKKITHEHPMLSLGKIHTIGEIKKFLNGKPGVASIKLDGLTVSATYINGKLTRLETRGNGEVGVDIMIHKNSIKGLPKTIEHNGKYVIDGECIITYNDFKAINDTLPDNEKFSNPRNMASGSLNLLDSNISATRGLTFLVWKVVEDTDYFRNSMKTNFETANDLGFLITPYTVLYHYNDSNTLEDMLNQKKAQAKYYGYPMDGVVFSYDDIEYGESLGKTGHHFNHSIAYKFADEIYTTYMKDIEWTMGKTGVLTPTAVFEPVDICGTIVERASMHNVSVMYEILNGGSFVGQKIDVFKANMIIPQIVLGSGQANPPKGAIMIPIAEKCPMCGALTEIRMSDGGVKNLVCTNPNCKGKLLGKFSHFVSKNAMNIEGLSEATLEKFINLGWIESFIDIYYLEDYKDQICKLEGFGKKSVEKLLKSIEKSRNTTLDRFLYSMSIPLIGRTASRAIDNYCKGNIDTFTFIMENTSLEFAQIDGIGVAATTSLDDWWYENRELFHDLLNSVINIVEKSYEGEKNITKLDGKTFVITGSLEHYKNRNELVSIIEHLGGKVSGSVSAKTSFLLNNDIESNSSKNKKAKSLGVPIISEKDFIKMIS